MGFPKGTIFKTLEERFWAKVEKTDTCWLWIGSVNEHGYGKMYVGLDSSGRRRTDKAHRISYRLSHGEIPFNSPLLHKCDNPKCVNPDHLFIGTQLDNIQDMKRKNRHAHGETSYAKITAEQARSIIQDPRPQRQIAKDYGLCQQTISRIKLGINWKHLSLPHSQ